MELYNRNKFVIDWSKVKITWWLMSNVKASGNYWQYWYPVFTGECPSYYRMPVVSRETSWYNKHMSY